jgi:hypothetical protein
MPEDPATTAVDIVWELERLVAQARKTARMMREAGFPNTADNLTELAGHWDNMAARLVARMVPA